MGIEIERKFLIDHEKLLADPKFHSAEKIHIWQGYLSIDPSIRIRQIILPDGSDKELFLTVKGKGLISRTEIDIDLSDSEYADLKQLCKSYIEKYRYFVDRWEIDFFVACSRDLLAIAEIELESEDELFERPDWLLKDVTNDSSYQNQNLSVLIYK